MVSNQPREPKKPELQDFGITPEQYATYFGRSTGKSPFLIFVILMIVVSATFVVLLVVVSAGFVSNISMRNVIDLSISLFILGWLLVVVAGLVAGLVESVTLRFKRSRMLKKPIASRIKLYEEALATYQAIQAEADRKQRSTERARPIDIETLRESRRAQEERWAEAERERQERLAEAERARQERRVEAERARQEAVRTRLAAERERQNAERAQQKAERAQRRKLAEHWMSLSGPEFERELGILFRQDGYLVEQTPSSGDQGVDLILRKDGQVTVVQCKSHQNPVGPAVARELYGSLHHFGADKAILACTGGFTQGVKEFVRGKPIVLISALDLVSMGEPLLGGSVMDRILEPEQPTLPIEPNAHKEQ